MYPGEWQNLPKGSSLLAAGLVDEDKKKVRDRDRDRDKNGVERHKSRDPKEPRERDPLQQLLARSKSRDAKGYEPFACLGRCSDISWVPEVRNLAGEGIDGEEGYKDQDGLLRQVKRMIVERVQHELSKVDHMIQERIHNETQSLRLQMESLQRDVAFLRAQAEGEPGLLDCHAPDKSSTMLPPVEACAHQREPPSLDLQSVNTALKKAKQGIEAQVSDLWAQIAAMQEGLEATHLRHKLRFVATSMLAISAADLSQEEKEISKRALQQEEVALKERLQVLADRLTKNRYSQASDATANGAYSPSNLTVERTPSRAEASDATAKGAYSPSDLTAERMPSRVEASFSLDHRSLQSSST